MRSSRLAWCGPLGLLLSGCAVSSAREPIAVHSASSAPYLAECITTAFNTRDPLVRSRPIPGGRVITVVDLREDPLAQVRIVAAAGGSNVVFHSDRSDRIWYERLLGLCVRLPARGGFG
jgi:hypothetical protein